MNQALQNIPLSSIDININRSLMNTNKHIFSNIKHKPPSSSTSQPTSIPSSTRTHTIPNNNFNREYNMLLIIKSYHVYDHHTIYNITCFGLQFLHVLLSIHHLISLLVHSNTFHMFPTPFYHQQPKVFHCNSSPHVAILPKDHYQHIVLPSFQFPSTPCPTRLLAHPPNRYGAAIQPLL